MKIYRRKYGAEFGRMVSNNSNHFDEDDIYIEFKKHIIVDLRNGKITIDRKLAVIGISKKIVNLKIKFKKNYKSMKF